MTSIASTIANATSTTTANDQNNSSSNGISQLSENFDNFLTILTAQLQNQDPLKPLDTHEFTNQLVLFTQAEQQVSINENLKTLISNNQETNNLGLLNYIDKDVEVTGQQFTLGEDGSQLSYTLPEDVRDATINIFNEENQLIINQQVTNTEGRHEFFWDGADASGRDVDHGVYRFTVSGNSVVQNEPVEITHTSLGRVGGVVSDASGNRLLIGDLEVPISSINVVLSQRDQQNATTNNNTTTTTTTN